MANKSAEEQKTTAATTASEQDAAARKVAKTTAAKRPRKDSDKTEADKATARPRPAALARPSIYESITSAAKKLEAERAAKSAAIKASAAAQSTTGKPAAVGGGEKTKRAANPFLAAPITRAKPAPSHLAKSVAPPTPPTVPSAAPSMALDTAPAAQPTVEPPAAVAAHAKSEPPTTTRSAATATAPTVVAAKPETSKRERAPQMTPSKTPSAARPSRSGTTTALDARPKAQRAQTASPATARPSAQISTTRPPATPPAPRPNRGSTPSGGQTHHRPMPPSGAQSQQRPGQLSRAPHHTPPRPQHRRAARPAAPVVAKPVVPPMPIVPAGPIAIPSVTTVRDLAPLLKVSVSDVLKKLITMGILATINQSLDYDTASLIAEEFALKTKPVAAAAPNVAVKPSAWNAAVGASKGQLRPPIVTVLGHVDHGKTSLLDAIRNAKVAAGEAGGITQHIGAYQIEKQGRKITFLDTPGHEAFTAMRARGAQLTDVAVLVVAADDGVMPQTIEAINHARAANVPIVVALNKIDRETADPTRVTRQLADHNVLVEEWGGDVPLVKVSARKLIGIDELLDMLLLVADLAEHRADPNLPAVGTVVEAEMDRSRGPVATLLVQNGMLRQNDYLVIAGIQGRIRAMFDDHGQRLSEAGPSTPVLVLGLPSVPEAGMTFQVVADERTARTLAERTMLAAQSQTARGAKALSLDDLYAQMQAGKIQELNVILKADVQGSLEPIRNSLDKLSSESLKVRVLHEGLGNISESDVSLALASGATVIGFNVEPDPAAKRLANMEGVDIRQYNIIYKLIEDVDKALKGLLEPTYKEVVTGRAQIRQVFKVNKKNVAGCYVIEGKATRSGQARVMRAGKPVFDGRIASLKRFTEDVREVLTNFECGVMLEGFEDVHQGDVIEFYAKEKVE